jgi:hypothetical protein
MESYESVMVRRDLRDNIIEITHDAGSDQWLVVRKMLDASKISTQVVEYFYMILADLCHILEKLNSAAILC